ncbi:bacillithiol system redox-active protein YtxJ [Salipaludibacillus keqinensis]|uniref:Bacillithiol system redox-active protein YtxJ n=2 Tax=Salipaludibacillus keqinensis TaxID=2045207 RepID=A0A323TWN1_9BACI|nr:bacillithiol system redox-active protein YtxJ [Salipaludibacillus keqinensis]
MKKIESKEQLTELYKQNEPFFLMKNSTTCPISSEAFNEMESYADSNPAYPVYYLNVQELRDVSHEIAEDLNVKHESPQVLFINKEEVVWNASHWKVTKKNAEKATTQL